MTETSDDKYPIHADMQSRQEERYVVQEVIDWISASGYTICEDVSRPTADWVEYAPISLRQDRLVAAIMGIDYDAFNAEKDAMLDEIRKEAHG